MNDSFHSPAPRPASWGALSACLAVWVAVAGCLGPQRAASRGLENRSGRIALVVQEHAETQRSQSRTALSNEPAWQEGTYPATGIFRGLVDRGVSVQDLSRRREGLRRLRALPDVLATLPEDFTDRQRAIWREGEAACDDWSGFGAQGADWQAGLRDEERWLCRGQVVDAVFADMMREAGVEVVLYVHNHRWTELNKDWTVFHHEQGAATVARAVEVRSGRTITALAAGENNVEAALAALSGQGTAGDTRPVTDIVRQPGGDARILYDGARALQNTRELTGAEAAGLGPHAFSLPRTCRDALPARLEVSPADSPFAQAVAETWAKLPKNRGAPAACTLDAVSDTRMLALRRFRLRCGPDRVFAAWVPGGGARQALSQPGGARRGLHLWPGMDQDPARRLVRTLAAGRCLAHEQQLTKTGLTDAQQQARAADQALFRARRVTNPGAVFVPGTFVRAETEALPAVDSALALCDGGLRRVHVDQTEVAGDRGPAVRIEAPCPATLLFTGALQFAPGPVRAAEVRPAAALGQPLSAGAPVTLAFGDSTAELKAVPHDGGGLRVTLKIDRTRQTLFYAPEGDGAEAVLVWAGDLDGDDALDLYLRASDHRKIEHHRLYLSKAARGSEFVREAAGFSTLRP